MIYIKDILGYVCKVDGRNVIEIYRKEGDRLIRAKVYRITNGRLVVDMPVDKAALKRGLEHNEKWVK